MFNLQQPIIPHPKEQLNKKKINISLSIPVFICCSYCFNFKHLTLDSIPYIERHKILLHVDGVYFLLCILSGFI